MRRALACARDSSGMAARPQTHRPPRDGLTDGHGPLAETMREITAIEERERLHGGRQEQIATRVTSATGNVTFALLNALFFAVWVLLNLPGMPTQFDPFPFALLTMLVSLEAILLSVFVLIAANAQSRRADQRARLNMQLDAVAEREITKLIELVAQIHEHLGLEGSARSEVQEMRGKTRLQQIADHYRALEEAEEHPTPSSDGRSDTDAGGQTRAAGASRSSDGSS
jgi:uncharacterized membrane protein